MVHNHKRSQSIADRLIRKYGRTGYLVRDGARRSCKVMIVDYTARERNNALILENSKHAMFSAIGLSVPPNYEMQDTLEVGTGVGLKVYKLASKVEALDTGGIPIYYDAQVVE